MKSGLGDRNNGWYHSPWPRGACLNEVRSRRPEQSQRTRPRPTQPPTVSMKSGLGDRNNERAQVTDGLLQELSQ